MALLSGTWNADDPRSQQPRTKQLPNLSRREIQTYQSEIVVACNGPTQNAQPVLAHSRP